MADPSPPRNAPTTRAEKMSILSALLGPEALARLREGQLDMGAKVANAPVAVDADRAAWHHNKLLERLRDQGRTATSPQPSSPVGAKATSGAAKPRQEAPRPEGTSHRSLDMRLAALADLQTLADEHPAVVTRLIRTLARQDRVTVLKSLPGPLARTVLKRLR